MMMMIASWLSRHVFTEIDGNSDPKEAHNQCGFEGRSLEGLHQGIPIKVNDGNHGESRQYFSALEEVSDRFHGYSYGSDVVKIR